MYSLRASGDSAAARTIGQSLTSPFMTAGRSAGMICSRSVFWVTLRHSRVLASA
jgi:hypothetical protein